MKGKGKNPQLLLLKQFDWHVYHIMDIWKDKISAWGAYSVKQTESTVNNKSRQSRDLCVYVGRVGRCVETYSELRNILPIDTDYDTFLSCSVSMYVR